MKGLVSLFSKIFIDRLPSVGGLNGRFSAGMKFFELEEFIGILYFATLFVFVMTVFSFVLVTLVTSDLVSLFLVFEFVEYLSFFLFVGFSFSLNWIQHKLLLRPVTDEQFYWCEKHHKRLGFFSPERSMNKYQLVRYVEAAYKLENDRFNSCVNDFKVESIL